MSRTLTPNPKNPEMSEVFFCIHAIRIAGIIKWISVSTVYSNTMWWPMSSGWPAVVYMFGKAPELNSVP
jgi:hypothetical protein